jgi:predicted transcriptional regulator
VADAELLMDHAGLFGGACCVWVGEEGSADGLIMLALSVRQPYAELILRGIKPVEYRSRATRLIGQRFWIYASSGRAMVPAGVWSCDLGDAQRPGWMMELAEQVGMIEPGAELPTGVIVGSAVIEKVTWSQGIYRWHLAEVRRARGLRRPARRPQPMWFRPY